jgi:beta-glucanase (GH16 family)
MKISFLSILGWTLAASASSVSGFGQAKLNGSFPPAGYTLKWYDAFDGNSLDLTKWIYRTDVKVSSSQTPQNVVVHGGNLVIWMRKQEDRGRQYTGGGVISKHSFHYGYFEARAKLFGGSGWHQSVWAMAVSDGSTTYPPNIRTEIDGLEFDSDTTWKGRMGLIIWKGPGHSQNRSCTAGVVRGPLGVDATTAFHTYGFEYTEQKVKYYLDGDLRCVLDYPPSEGEHDEINLWLTAIGYELRGAKIDQSKLPGQMLVDFAAFYESETPR